MNDIPDDLRQTMADERHGSGPLSVDERVEMNELLIIREERGRLGLLNATRLDHLIKRSQADNPIA
jgi:hypothetical protein